MQGNATTEFEKKRLAMQSSLDAAKGAAERNRLGQFATPTRLATDILRYAKVQLGESEAIRFYRPCNWHWCFLFCLARRIFKQQSVNRGRV